MAKSISPGLLNLLREPSYAQIATVMPDGSPQVTQVWIDTDGEHILVNTVRGHQKELNIRRDPRVAVNVVDPANSGRWATIRGRVIERSEEGAAAHIDQLAGKYMGVERYPFGSPEETRVLMKIAPERISELGLEDGG